MRIIVHCDRPDDMLIARSAVAESIKHDYASCGYGFGKQSVFVYRNKTGWTVRVQADTPALPGGWVGDEG